MNEFRGETLSWKEAQKVIELALHRLPCNEIGSQTLAELEQFGSALRRHRSAAALIIYSQLPCGFSAGADLRETYSRGCDLPPAQRAAAIRDFLVRIHQVFNLMDACPITTIAAVHGVAFGGGFELALTADIIIADKTARFCFPELRLGLIPGFGGIPRLKRDLGNSLVRDLLLTGRSINAAKAREAGLVSQLTAPGEALRVARATAAQAAKFDRHTAGLAKAFIKQIPHEELRQEIDIFCELFLRPEVEQSLRKFVESDAALPYLP